MADVYYSDRLRSWHLCFTFRDLEDAKLFIKDMEKYDRKVLTGPSYWKLDKSKEPHVVGTIFEREVNFNYVRQTAKKFNGKEYKIADDSWINEMFNKSSFKIIGDAGSVIGKGTEKS